VENGKVGQSMMHCLAKFSSAWRIEAVYPTA